MEENIVLLNKLGEVLNILSTQEDEKKKIEIILNNLDLFEDLKEKIKEVANTYLMKEYKNNKQNEEANKLKMVIVKLIENNNVIKKVENIQDLILAIINTLSFYENRLIFRLRHKKNLNIVYEALDYQIDREDYKKIIDKSIKVEEDSKLGQVVEEYKEDDYETTMFDNVIRVLRNNEGKITKEDVKTITKKIEDSTYITEMMSKDESKLCEKEILMIEKYIVTIIGLKSKLIPQLLSSDILVEKFIQAKVKNEKFSLYISNSLTIDIFEDVLKNEKHKKVNDLDKKIEDLNNDEIKKINDVLKKAGIKISIETKEIDDDNNYLVTTKDLKNQYEKLDILQLYKKREEFYKANINEIRKNEKPSSTQRRAYLEISIIISMMTKQMKKKINPGFIEFIERNKLKSKKCDINPSLKLENQKITNEETIALLAIIYKDNICSQEERKELEKTEEIERLNIELDENKERYNKVYNILMSLKKKD